MDSFFISLCEWPQKLLWVIIHLKKILI
jgi:hypothetical protein